MRRNEESKMRALRLWGVVMFLASAVAFGHGNTKPLHGGVVQMVGETSFELVTKPEGAELYVVEDGEDIESAKMSAMLTIDAGGTKSEVVMLAAGSNKFVSKGTKIPSGAKVLVRLVGADQAKTMARFTIK
jgi:hypothetical protein